MGREILWLEAGNFAHELVPWCCSDHGSPDEDLHLSLIHISVGSRTISKDSELKLSSATIRNEMSDLEEMGYIIQPHTSAGRIPSDKGYRFYVDQIMQEKENEVTEFKDVMVQKVDKLELVLKKMAQALSLIHI